MFPGRNPELVVENVVRDFRHVIPVRGDIVRDEILQCQDTVLVLRPVTNITVFWSMPTMMLGMKGVAANAAQQPQPAQQTSSAMAADLWVSARWVTQRGNS